MQAEFRRRPPAAYTTRGTGSRDKRAQTMGFGRLLSSIGVGAATVDTRLERDERVPGEAVRGVVEVNGGGSEQKVNGIRLEIQTYYKRESGQPRHRNRYCRASQSPGTEPSGRTRGRRSRSPFACPTTHRVGARPFFRLDPDGPRREDGSVQPFR